MNLLACVLLCAVAWPVLGLAAGDRFGPEDPPGSWMMEPEFQRTSVDRPRLDHKPADRRSRIRPWRVRYYGSTAAVDPYGRSQRVRPHVRRPHDRLPRGPRRRRSDDAGVDDAVRGRRGAQADGLSGGVEDFARSPDGSTCGDRVDAERLPGAQARATAAHPERHQFKEDITVLGARHKHPYFYRWKIGGRLVTLAHDAQPPSRRPTAACSPMSPSAALIPIARSTTTSTGRSPGRRGRASTHAFSGIGPRPVLGVAAVVVAGRPANRLPAQRRRQVDLLRALATRGRGGRDRGRVAAGTDRPLLLSPEMGPGRQEPLALIEQSRQQRGADRLPQRPRDDPDPASASTSIWRWRRMAAPVLGGDDSHPL